MTEPSIPERTVELAHSIFGDNLLAAWVGGSYARGEQSPTSDVDTVVILRDADRERERSFAEQFRDLHRQAGLKFDHCGEIFDLTTLERLLNFTEACLEAVPAIQQSACYLADCPLSIFRKGDVVLKMLEEPKIHVLDPGRVVDLLTARATGYFLRWPMPRIQPYKNQLNLPAGGHAAALAARWESLADTRQWTDTPVGISLHRWFGPELIQRAHAFNEQPPVTAADGEPHTCPLPVADEKLARALTAQCLSHPAVIVSGGVQ